MPKRTMKEIKRIGADLKPTIHVGKDGITDSLIEEVKLQVKTRKVVKIRLLPASGDEKDVIGKEISERSGAVLVDVRGSIVLLTQQDFLDGKGYIDL
jgi:RNA-binding protein